MKNIGRKYLMEESKKQEEESKKQEEVKKPRPPKTLEEAIKVIESDGETMRGVAVTAMLNAFARILIIKGVMTEEEFEEECKTSQKAVLEETAKNLLKMLGENK